MDALAWEAEPPQLRSPALVCAFAGWNDAAGAATTALTTAAESLDAEVFAQVDPEEFFDFQANRPTITLSEGQTREIEWPGNVLMAASPSGAERDLVLLAGTEPNLRWRTFSDGIAEVAEQLGVEMVITLGALIADVAHTLPVPITGLASDPEMVERLGLARSSYQGPTGVVGVVHDACNRRGMPSASLWAAVPHYVAAVPNPKAALALLRRLEGLAGVAVEASALEEETESFESQVTDAVSANPEIQELVERLESEQAEGLEAGDDIPSGESLARDFEHFLRQQGGGPTGPRGPAGS
jgi:proteasome assembly chaperone (PAC2) family protein